MIRSLNTCPLTSLSIEEGTRHFNTFSGCQPLPFLPTDKAIHVIEEENRKVDNDRYIHRIFYRCQYPHHNQNNIIAGISECIVGCAQHREWRCQKTRRDWDRTQCKVRRMQYIQDQIKNCSCDRWLDCHRHSHSQIGDHFSPILEHMTTSNDPSHKPHSFFVRFLIGLFICPPSLHEICQNSP